MLTSTPLDRSPNNPLISIQLEAPLPLRSLLGGVAHPKEGSPRRDGGDEDDVLPLGGRLARLHHGQHVLERAELDGGRTLRALGAPPCGGAHGEVQVRLAEEDRHVGLACPLNRQPIRREHRHPGKALEGLALVAGEGECGVHFLGVRHQPKGDIRSVGVVPRGQLQHLVQCHRNYLRLPHASLVHLFEKQLRVLLAQAEQPQLPGVLQGWDFC
mmetsp:Transcript_26924/g.58761  ORF Transcript_26924/g.58761 Transcript_26924/m.58761 type:complete len:214 (+) Transcript_26924:394-1035(+)